MTIPGADPNYPPYGWGDGTSPLAHGADAFETKPEDNIDVRTDTDYTRRERKANTQELGFTIPSMAAHEETPAAAIDVENFPDESPNFAETTTDDANTAAPRVRT